MKLSLLIALLMFNSFIAVPTSMAQRYNSDDLRRNCELETVYRQQYVEDSGDRMIVSMLRKLEEFYRNQPATINTWVQDERCTEWKEETCLSAEKVKGHRDQN